MIGENQIIKAVPNALNKQGLATANLIGGNLCMIAHLIGSKNAMDTKGKILFIEDIGTTERDHECVPEPTKPEGITDEEMIDFIDKNTGYKRQEIIDQIKSGQRDLEDFYLDILGIVKRKEITGF